MEIDEINQHMFKLSVALDKYSAGKDYVALRKTHYDNIQWLQQHGLAEEYYKVLFADIKRSRENDNNKRSN